MSHTFIATEQTQWIAHDGVKVIATGILEAGQQVSTGQPYLETFTSPRAYNARLVELGGPPEGRKAEEPDE
jgi:hypothetical protein